MLLLICLSVILCLKVDLLSKYIALWVILRNVTLITGLESVSGEVYLPLLILCIAIEAGKEALQHIKATFNIFRLIMIGLGSSLNKFIIINHHHFMDLSIAIIIYLSF